MARRRRGLRRLFRVFRDAGPQPSQDAARRSRARGQRLLSRASQSDAAWLAELCLSRVGFVFIVTTYSAALPLLKIDWSMSASEAGLVQSAWHVGYLVSLFVVGFLTDRYGAENTLLAGSVLATTS